MLIAPFLALPLKLLRTFALVFLLCFGLPLLSQSPNQSDSPADTRSQANAALDRGVEAFKNAQFEEAVRLFTLAKSLDPSLLNAHLYLATSYASEYIPGAPTEENTQLGKLATDAFKEVLQIDPQNLSAIDGLASILYQRAGQPFDEALFSESKTYHQKHIELKSQDPQPYYSIGVIDWALSYRGNTLLRAEFNKTVDGEGLRDSDPLPEPARSEYVRQFGALVDEGMNSLKQAIELKPDYEDAMTYLNLLYRRKADMADSSEEREQFSNQADELLDHVKEIKTKKAEPAEPENK